MPTVKLVDDAAASPRVRAVFDDIKATKKIERIPNFWRALAVAPRAPGAGAGPGPRRS